LYYYNKDKKEMDTENQQTTLITEKQTQFWTEDCGFLTMQ
jgi:hypothetical protein